MKAFFDSSGLAKRYIEEPGSSRVQEILEEATSLGLSAICIPEIVSALCRRKREGSVSHKQYQEAKASLLNEAADSFVVNLTQEILLGTIALLEKSTLRAMDAIHIACAMEWNADLFVSSHEKQLLAAKKAGLKITQV